MASLTAKARFLIKCLKVKKRWNALRMMQECPLRKWKKSTLNDLIRKIGKTGSEDQLQVVIFLELLGSDRTGKCKSKHRFV